MSIYFQKGRGWKYDFTLRGVRHTSKYFDTKKEVKQAEAIKREEVLNPKPEATLTDMAFLDLVNMRLDHILSYNSEGHYQQCVYKAKRWVSQWKDLMCSEITRSMIEAFLIRRRKKGSPFTANTDLRYLRATFNHGLRRKLIVQNPTEGIEFFPVQKKMKSVPIPEDIDLVIEMADCDTQQYLWTMRETLGRMGEINRLTWDDVNFEERCVILYTRKKKGGHLTPRKIPMTEKLFQVLSSRFKTRSPEKPWVFWHRYVSSKTGQVCEGPFRDRKKFMKTLCRDAGVTYFRFHPIRHSGASLMDHNHVPVIAIQKILGHENRTTTEIYLHSMSGTVRLHCKWEEVAR